MKKKKLKNIINEEMDNFMSEFLDNDDQSTEDTIDNSLKGATIEVRGEGSRLTGKIIQVKETKNGVIIIFITKWRETEELHLYFDDFEELKNNKKVSTMDGEIFIK